MYGNRYWIKVCLWSWATQFQGWYHHIYKILSVRVCVHACVRPSAHHRKCLHFQGNGLNLEAFSFTEQDVDYQRGVVESVYPSTWLQADATCPIDAAWELRHLLTWTWGSVEQPKGPKGVPLSSSACRYDSTTSGWSLVLGMFVDALWMACFLSKLMWKPSRSSDIMYAVNCSSGCILNILSHSSICKGVEVFISVGVPEGFSLPSLADAKTSAAPDIGTCWLHGEIVAWPRLHALLIMHHI